MSLLGNCGLRLRFVIALLALLGALHSSSLLAESCQRDRLCIDCAVGLASPKALAMAPPLFWDHCAGARREEKTIYFVPSRLVVAAHAGGKLQFVRKLSNGDLLLNAKLVYRPWGVQDESSVSPFLREIGELYGDPSFKPAVPSRAKAKFLGLWNEWIKSVKMSPLNGIDYYQNIGLSLVLDGRREMEVRQALKRPLGLLGQAFLEIEGVRLDGSRAVLRQTIPIHIGNLEF